MRYIATLLAVFLLPVTSFADPLPVSAWLDKMSHSFRELNYRGIFTYEHGDDIESLRLTHAVFDNKEFERLDYLDGEERHIVRLGHQLNCIHPGHKLVRLYQNRATDVQWDLDQFYTLALVDEGRSAGKQTVIIGVSPKDTHRFAQRLHLDKETGLLLKSELYGAEEKVLERFQFVDIQIGVAVDRSLFDLNQDTRYEAEHILPEQPAGQALMTSSPPWLVNWLPAGFKAATDNTAIIVKDMATFTDGLAVFSVFIEPVKATDSAEGRARRGATAAYSKALVLDGRPHRVTVVGEIPLLTAERVAQSVAFASP